ncbi:NAD-dependent epimerase/dehydratase family protein [Glaciecola siphonariae]|uniref:NAD-dependent epimerase/dehydratase family protein n=1 Tax=Glaciecola siphonariae TaxID=521012 RepID=A0ABV9LX54_9ALTE
MKKQRVIIIGAGAITQQWHLPILLGRDDVEVSGIVDKSEKTLSILKDAYPSLHTFTDLSQIPVAQYDAAIVATPAAFHFAITEGLLQKQKHVLVEKPVAFSVEETIALADLAKQNNCVLSVSLYRRLYPSLQTLKSLIADRVWGKAESFEFLWGDAYSWSASSLGNMKKELAGGGVLMDLGPHALDWLCELFGHKVSLLEYSDDAVSGIETDCEMQLSFQFGRQKIKGDVKLSRIRKLGGELTVFCEKAALRLSVGERFKVEVLPNLPKSTAKDVATPSVVYECESSDTKDEEWFETFAKEHDDFLHAIEQSTEPKLSCASVIAAAQIIDQCYAEKSQTNYDWGDTSALSIADLSGVKQVLITGATGFLGGRIVETLLERTDCKVIAAVNNPNNATRISRYDVAMRMCDLNDPSSVKQALEGCDSVIHCAVGTAYGDDELIYNTTVKGTETLITLAEEAGISKFVHISSLASVDLASSEQKMTEDNARLSTSNDIYSRAKRDAEKIVLDALQRKTLTGAVLRPTNIYGPYSPLFNIGAGRQAVEQGMAFTQSTAQCPSNTVYVDNVVMAILHCLSSEKLARQVYFINDDDKNTYQDFYAYFTHAFETKLEIGKLKVHQETASSENTLQLIFKDAKDLVKSKELRKLFIKVFKSPLIGKPFRWLVAKLPSVENKLRDNSGVVYKSKNKSDAVSPISASTSALVSCEQFKEDVKAYKPVSRDDALARTSKWLAFYNPKP